MRYVLKPNELAPIINGTSITASGPCRYTGLFAMETSGSLAAIRVHAGLTPGNVVDEIVVGPDEICLYESNVEIVTGVYIEVLVGTIKGKIFLTSPMVTR